MALAFVACYMSMVIDHAHIDEPTMSRMIKASEFKAKCLGLLDEVERTGDRIVITKKGKPVADIVPHKPAQRSLLGLLKGRLEITGDIISPIDVEWEALK
jgi:prevent-host-death family protein